MRSAQSAGSLASSVTQSPTMMRAGCGAAAAGCSKLPRGALEGAPRRDTTMTQNSDSGDAAGDAGPTNRRREGCPRKVKITFTEEWVFHSIDRGTIWFSFELGGRAAFAAFGEWT